MAFYDMQGEGYLVLPIFAMVTLLLDLRPEALHTFVSFGVKNIGFYTRIIIGNVPLFPVYKTTPFLYHGRIIGIFTDHKTMVL